MSDQENFKSAEVTYLQARWAALQAEMQQDLESLGVPGNSASEMTPEIASLAVDVVCDFLRQHKNDQLAGRYKAAAEHVISAYEAARADLQNADRMARLDEAAEDFERIEADVKRHLRSLMEGNA